MKSTEPFVYIVAPVPPPIHGMASMTADIVSQLQSRARFRIGNVSSGTSNGIVRHFVKLARTVRAVVGVVAGAGQSHEPALYIAANGEFGICYDIAVALTGRICGYRTFLHHHSFAYIDRRSALMSMLAKVMGRQGTHIVLCDDMEAKLRACYPAIHNTMVMLSSAFIPPNPRSDTKNSSEFRIGFLSNLIIEKGVDTSIDLLRAARSEGLPVKLILAGKSPDARATEMVKAARAEFGSAFDYLGQLPEEEKTAFYQSLDAFVFPTRYVHEAQPRAVLDALAAGVPVLSVARSCITSDMGDCGGLCAAMGTDFVAQALPLVRLWCSDSEAHRRAMQGAAKRGAFLHERGVQQRLAVANALSARI